MDIFLCGQKFFNSCGLLPRSVAAGSYGMSILSFVRNHQMGFKVVDPSPPLRAFFAV